LTVKSSNNFITVESGLFLLSYVLDQSDTTNNSFYRPDALSVTQATCQSRYVSRRLKFENQILHTHFATTQHPVSMSQIYQITSCR